MTRPTTTDITRALESIEATERDDSHPRSIARDAIRRHRQATAIDRSYDFSKVSDELRQIVYNVTVRYSRRRWWSRWLR